MQKGNKKSYRKKRKKFAGRKKKRNFAKASPSGHYVLTSFLMHQGIYAKQTNKSDMTKEKILAATLPLLMAGAMPACAQNYVMKSASREHIIIDNRYGSTKEAENFVRPYKNIVDSVMAPLVGYSARYMKAHTPESELSNLLADIMVWGGKMYDEKPDIGLYNMGGIRAALPKGRVTFGDINDIAPFENKICFLSLSGEQLTTLFRQIGRTFGAGISHGVEAVYEKGNLVSLRLNGEEIDPKRDYRIATIDYLIHGNDGFKELRNGHDTNIPKADKDNTRFIISAYFKEKMAEGKEVDAHIEGRMVCKE